MLESCAAISAALRADPSLGGLAANLSPSGPETDAVTMAGAAPLLTARLVVSVEDVVSDPITA